MGIFRPELPRRMVTMDLATGETPTWYYKLSLREREAFPDGSYAVMEFRNSFKQLIQTWDGYVLDGVVRFPDVTADLIVPLVRGTTFVLNIEDVDGRTRQPIWGHVVRNEARYPDNPDNNTEFVGVSYEYDFGTLGRVVDPSWDVKNGAPTVWNGGGVACGILFDDAAMLWYGEFRGDSIEINYSIINGGAGKSSVAFCSNSDMSNYLAVTHETGLSNNKMHVEVGSGPVSLTSKVNVPHTSATGNNYTIRYNSITNTVAVYLGTNMATPVITYTDDGNLVDHGDGERYYGLNWRASLLAPGVRFTKIRATDLVA